MINKFELEIKNLTTNRICKTKQMGSIFTSKCDDFSHTFSAGLTFLAGEIYDGGWSVADFLARPEEGDESAVELYWNGRKTSVEEIRKTVYYVSDNMCGLEHNKKTVEENLQDVFCEDKVGMDYETFVKTFQLRELARFDRRVLYTGHSFWFYTAVFGIGMGKRIIAYPWLSATEISVQSYRFNLLAKLATQFDFLVLVPAETKGVRVRRNLPENKQWYEVVQMRGGAK